ncbi:SDR family oxidoreductase [Pelagibacterium montanilacus]|uniref:SDR family oxidoreductase n=1 Tax=Pelagibacterium montanilacus TaxID=2185280 RepID=UPI0019D192FB|nr:SDR family oxidoreductase [Pelagibacterium montanilacus]
MVERLAGKRALVTGAGQGIGRAVAAAFAEEGAIVAATSRTREKMDALVSAHETITALEMDVTDADAVKAVFEQAGPVDILVNCAGWVHNGTILECDEEGWARSLDQNATACFRTMKAALPGMLARGSGAIVNVASVASSVTGVANRAAYGASKAALVGLSKAVARDFIGKGIRCNVLAPGTTQSPSLTERIEATDDPDATRAAFIARQPMGRLGTIEEMAAACVYLASEESAFMTGTVLVVDGGQTL